MVSGCQHVIIKDAEVCGDMGNDGATCFHTLTNQQRDIPKAEWDKERFGQVCTQSQNFADWKTALEELCHETSDCTYQMKEQIENFFIKLNKIKSNNN